MIKRKRGRPPLPTDQRMTRAVFGFTPKQRDKLRRLAKSARMSQAAVLRLLVDESDKINEAVWYIQKPRSAIKDDNAKEL